MNFNTTSLEKAIFQFLDTHYHPAFPVLLGLSGGPDSLALFHLLIKYSQVKPLKFGVAHIDHGWRQESGNEARALQSLASHLSIPFHLKKLSPSELEGNLEAACREERIKYFSALCEEEGYQAVLLGHHADDQAETVLKRLLEGASITVFSGLKSMARMGSLHMWRPLLSISKRTILEWLHANGIVPFNDSTNVDQKYLRARMRTQMIPELSKQFGKEISDNLFYVGLESQELSEFLNEVLKNTLNKIEEGKQGVFLDLSEEQISSPFAIKYVLKHVGLRVNCLFSRQILQEASHFIRQGTGARTFECNGYRLFIDRKRIFLTKSLPQIPKERMILELGSFQYGDWNVEVTESDTQKERVSGWKGVWDGALSISLPKDEYYFAPALLQSSFPGFSPISKWWTNEKVPAFLRQCIPVIWKGDMIYHEFLTNRREKRFEAATKYLNINFISNK